MKHDLILYRPLADDVRIPNWLDFISDKSVVQETVDPAANSRVLSAAERRFGQRLPRKWPGRSACACVVIDRLKRLRNRRALCHRRGWYGFIQQLILSSFGKGGHHGYARMEKIGK
jgi:hypothetical protein